MSNKIIIFSTCCFILISFVYLSYAEKNQADINTKNIWMLYFENPKDTSLNFKIENHSSNTDFHWQVLENNAIKKEGDASVTLGETKLIPIWLNSADVTGKNINISVTTGNEKKEVYKNL